MAKSRISHADELLTRSEVAAIFGVTAKTVTRWASQGRVPTIRTLGGHRRYRVTDIERVLAIGATHADEDERAADEPSVR
ncbi:MAG: binding domain protein excisionase family [Frankiales bacterium]|jgi:excisionase family DNA binding protein|nr:binding domain protein excisionase family [Frankiales bacterium]